MKTRREVKANYGNSIIDILNLKNGKGDNSLEQKYNGIAIGGGSIALNSGIAKGTNSFAETSGIAETTHSHAEGEWGIARGWASHAEGGETIATHSYQHVEGIANEGKQLTQHEIGNGRFSFTAVSPKPNYHNATHFGSSGDGYGTTYYFADLGGGRHTLITEKSYTEEEYAALANVYIMERDGKNIFEVYKYGSLSNGAHVEDLKLFMLAFIATQLPGSSYSLEDAILAGYQDLSTTLTPYLAAIKTYLAEVYPAYATQIAAATSIDQLMGLLVTSIFGTATPASNYIISPVSMANGLGNFIYSLATFVSGYGNTIGASNDVTSGTGSAAIGVNNTIKSQNSIAVGDSNLLEKSNGSSALGYNNEVKPADSNSPDIVNAFAIGNHLKNNYSNSLVVGKYNADFDPSAEKLFQVGNGSDGSHRSNAFEALADGRARVYGAPQGDNDVVRKLELDSLASTYAGGTAITLNGVSKAAGTASFYAPITAGTSGRVLVSSGSGAPTWSNTVSSDNISDSSATSNLFIHRITPANMNTITDEGLYLVTVNSSTLNLPSVSDPTLDLRQDDEFFLTVSYWYVNQVLVCQQLALIKGYRVIRIAGVQSGSYHWQSWTHATVPYATNAVKTSFTNTVFTPKSMINWYIESGIYYALVDFGTQSTSGKPYISFGLIYIEASRETNGQIYYSPIVSVGQYFYRIKFTIQQSAGDHEYYARPVLQKAQTWDDVYSTLTWSDESSSTGLRLKLIQ